MRGKNSDRIRNLIREFPAYEARLNDIALQVEILEKRASQQAELLDKIAEIIEKE